LVHYKSQSRAILQALLNNIPADISAESSSDGTNSLNTNVYVKARGTADRFAVTGLVVGTAQYLDTLAIGSQGAAFAQRAGTNDIMAQLRTAGVEYDARQIRALTTADAVSAAGSNGFALNQDVNNNLQTSLFTPAGAAYDARQIRALTSADAVDVSDRAARAVGKIDPASRAGIQFPQGTDIDPRKSDPGTADTLFIHGFQTAPGAGATITTITPGVVGNYQVYVTISITGKVGLVDSSNCQLFKNAVLKLTLATGLDRAVQLGPFRMALIATDTISVRTFNAGSANAIYGANIAVTQTG